MPDRYNVFISYARLDGSGFAERLYNDLRAHGITAWRDTKNLNLYSVWAALRTSIAWRCMGLLLAPRALCFPRQV